MKATCAPFVITYAAEPELDVYLMAGVSATEKSEVYWADNCESDGIYWTCTFIESIDVLTADWLHVSSVQ